MANLTPGQRARLPRNAVRAAPPPSPQDSTALVELKIRLEDAVEALSAVAADPIVIAASPNRFNDSDWSEWRAIRVGSFFTERNDYGVWTPHDWERDLARGPEAARTARRVLDVLDGTNWRYLFSAAFGLRWTDQVLALVIQSGVPWLVFSSSNATEENHVFSLWDGESLEYFGECVERFDQQMEESPALRFQEPAAGPALPSDPLAGLPSDVAITSPQPVAVDPTAFATLKSLLADAVIELKALAVDPIVIAASPNRFNDARWSEWRAIRFDSFFTEEPPYPLHDHINFDRDLANGPAGARAVNQVLDRLEAAGWRDLFSDAFNLGWSGQVLALVIQDGRPWLVYGGYSDEHHVFALWGDDPLVYFGECVERFDWEMQETPPLKFQKVE